MCKKFLFVVAVAAALLLGTRAMGADIAFYVGAPNVDGWYTVAAMNADVATIIDQTGDLFADIQQFDDTQFDEFGAWVDDNTDDGELDIIWLNGCMPSVLYPVGNAQPDGSRAEKWLDGGNMFINVGDWFGYITYEGGARSGTENQGPGAANILDLDAAIISGAAQGTMNVTQAGQEYLPSLNAVAAERPVSLNAVVAPWEVAEVFGQNTAGTYADPVVIHNTETDGYVAFINQAVTWINDRGLTCAEFINNWVVDVIGFGPNPYARHPNPKDGAMYADTWITMSWDPGAFAVSHDFYMGDNFDDVNNATRDSELFRGNLPLRSTYAAAGFTGFPYPDGLVPGTTYYWRIDEVNAPPDETVYKGPVWSFWIPSKTARQPVPANGAAFVDSAKATLSWTAGLGAKLHYVYFADDYDTVANATGAMPQGLPTYNPGPLELEKTYYWRVDESDGYNTYTGDVWSFRTAREGGGVKAQYYNGMNFETLVLTRMDPQINFNWGDPGSPDASVAVDQFSARWTGEVEAAFTETYTFYTNSDDGVRLWIDGVQVVDSWIDQSPTEHSGTIDLVAGTTYSLVMEFYENGGGAVAELRWSSPSTPKQLIPQAALSPPVRASAPSPFSGATGTKMTPILKWNPGDYAASHEVYFGTDANAVRNADKTSPEYKGSKALGNESYDPGKLAWFTTYYWRVDEVNAVNPDGPWAGNLWSFTTGDFILIDDFEDYDSGENQIWYAWKDGLGYGAIGTDPYYPGNGTGAAVGDETTDSYTEETIVHAGRQSMPLSYDNNKTGFSKYSETELTLTDTRDWTDEDVAELSLWFRGYPASTGSFVEAPAGTFTMTASGTDIWLVNNVEADEFHYAYKMLAGAGSITARVVSVENTDPWAKAGVMIRESLDPDSAHAFACMTPDYGVAMQYRPSTGGTSANYNQTGVAAPYWVKVERSISGLFTVSQSANGTNFQPVTGAVAQTIPMATNVYIGLALTAHNAAETCQAVFSNVTTSGNVTGQWQHQDIGITSNDAEPLYVAVSNSAGNPAIVIHPDPAAAQIDTWTEWPIQLSDLADQGINLADVDRLAIGLGTRGNTAVPGGSGKIFIDDIRLYRAEPEPEPEPEP
jgi:hypothetical protein